jgi:hypothetical protein
MKKRHHNSKLIAILGLMTVILLGGELALRYFCGFTNAPLYQSSDEWEYMNCPNQEGYRFGRRYYFNSYGQRSEEPDSTRTIVLGLGDSVLYGGMMVDQDSTSTYLFGTMTGMQMLNISSGSWGPDNCAAYLKHYGLFGAKAMFLLVSSHDAHDNMDFQPIVGNHIYYPSKQYKTAWSELFNRYIAPKMARNSIGKWLGIKIYKEDPDQKVLSQIGGIRKKGGIFNPGFSQLKLIADSAGIPFVVCLHPETVEVKAGDFNNQGHEIIQWCKTNQVLLINELEEGIKMDMFRDAIHTNEKGHQFEAKLMYKYLMPLLTNSATNSIQNASSLN